VTPIRSRRSHMVHVSWDLKRTLCGRPVKAWIVEPDAPVTCLTCHISSTTN
jgi:hypothetical protein